MGVITGPIWRLLHVAMVVDGALSLQCPALPQPLSTQFLQPLGVGTMLCRVLELAPTPFPYRMGARALDVFGGWGGFLRFHARAPVRLGPWTCPWGVRGDSGVQCRKKEYRGLAPTLRLTLQPRGSGLSPGSQQLSLGNSEGVVLEWGRGAKRGQECFPSGFKVADGGLHGQEWAGSAGGAGRRREKGPLGLHRPAPCRADTGRAGVWGPVPDGCPWLLGGCEWAHPTDLLNVRSFSKAHLEEHPRQPAFLPACAATITALNPRTSLGPHPSRICL